MEFLFYAAILGLIPAFIAQRKGRDFFSWWLYGAALFIFAIIHSIFIVDVGKEKSYQIQQYSDEEDRSILEKIESFILTNYPGNKNKQKALFDHAVDDYFYMKGVPDIEVKKKAEEDYPYDYTKQRGIYNQQVLPDDSNVKEQYQHYPSAKHDEQPAGNHILKEYRSYIRIVLTLIVFLLILLSFHYVPQHFKMFPKDNFTFNNTIILQSDIDKCLKKYNEASIFEQMTIINETLFKKLREKELIYFTETSLQNNNEQMESNLTSKVVEDDDFGLNANYSNEDKKIIERIKSKVKRDYPENYSVQKIIFDQEIDDYYYLKNVLDKQIKRKVEKDYPNDYSLQRVMYNQEVEAKEQMK